MTSKEKWSLVTMLMAWPWLLTQELTAAQLFIGIFVMFIAIVNFLVDGD